MLMIEGMGKQHPKTLHFFTLSLTRLARLVMLLGREVGGELDAVDTVELLRDVSDATDSTELRLESISRPVELWRFNPS